MKCISCGILHNIYIKFYWQRNYQIDTCVITNTVLMKWKKWECLTTCPNSPNSYAQRKKKGKDTSIVKREWGKRHSLSPGEKREDEACPTTKKIWAEKNSHDFSVIPLAPIIFFFDQWTILQVRRSTMVCNIEIIYTSCELTNQRAAFWPKTDSKKHE